MYEEMCCVCVVSECADVVLCAVVDSIVRYPIMCGSMAPLCSLSGCMSLGVLLRTLWCMECYLRPVLVHFLDKLAQNLVVVG